MGRSEHKIQEISQSQKSRSQVDQQAYDKNKLVAVLTAIEIITLGRGKVKQVDKI